MRADRLVALLLFLQERGRATVAEVAAELEVSVRTARRDLEALALGGVPVYSQRGRGGGWSLVGGARTNLTGLTAAEARALFLLAGPASTTPAARAALRKLVRALPAPLREGAESASRAGIIDDTDWTATSVSPGEAALGELQRAVVEGLQVRLGYESPGRPARVRTVHPLGLVVKAGVWYLMAGTEAGLRTFRLTRVRSVELTALPVERPPDFDLAAEWRARAGLWEERLTSATVRLRFAGTELPLLERLFPGQLRIVEPEPEPGPRPGADHADWFVDDSDATAARYLEAELDGPSARAVASRMAGLGARVEVLGPEAARAYLAAMGEQLTRMYGPSATPADPPAASPATDG